MTKRITGIVIAALILVTAYFLPDPEGLSTAGKMGLAVLFSGVSLWLFESFPTAITGFILLLLMPILDVITFPEAVAGFMSPVLLFILGAFSLTIAMMNTNLGARITGVLLNWAGDNSEKLVLGFMLAGCLVSSIMQNTTTTMLFLGIAFTLVAAMGAKPRESNLVKALMLGIPLAVMTGGIATPIGTAINVMGMQVLSDVAGLSISFLQWTVIAYPIALVMVFVEWFFIVKVFKPEPVNKEALAVLEKEVAAAGPFSVQEIKLVSIIGLLLVLWFAGAWFPQINSTMVALLGLILFFVPGIDLMTWDDYNKGVPWSVLLVIGCIMSVAGGVLATGGASWMAEGLVASVSGLSGLVVLLIVTTFVVLLHAVFPMGPALVGLLIPPLAAVGMSTGLFSPVAITLIVSMGVGVCYLLPLNPVLMITYSPGHYTMGDVFKTGLVPTIVFILLLTFWVSFMMPIVGL
ncbi:MAG TPA: DASS family sodium-coupled anion symporter [Syntrophomonadaceae bacterium]|nr:DASS family sodium-coupled anion symporter [Syntrophomonadaceae bacterium]